MDPAEHADAELRVSVYAEDHHLGDATRRDGRTRVAVLPVSGLSVVLGHGSRPEQELHLDAIAADRVPVLRRRGGGCSVVLDPGNLVVSVALPIPGLGGIRSSFARISQWLINKLEEAGVPGISEQGISDLTIGERKIAGSCIHRSKDLLAYSTTLLVTPDLELVERYLQHPPREPEYRRGRSHRDFMTSIAEVSDIKACEELQHRLAPLLERSVSTLL